MKRNWYGSIGTVSHATMRTEDLIPSFLWEAKHLRLTKAERKSISGIAKSMGASDYYESENADYDLEDLFNILDNHALPYFYFGAHPGDGSDYGWWLTEQFEEDFDGLKVNDLSEVPTGHTGEVLLVNDHGNMTLYSASRGRLHEVWGIV
jgi:hypothetical protein